MAPPLFDLLETRMLRSLFGSTSCKEEEPVFTLQRRRIQRIGFLIGLLGAFSLLSVVSTTAADFGDGPLNADTGISQPGQIERLSSPTTPPRKASDLLTQLEKRGGIPLPGYVGGRDFQNRERRLPRGFYREYDVNPKIRGRGRDAERIVIERRTGKAYYTGDHYRTFVPLN
ncbi:ribonuclease domain-containing protein [Candidatus Nitrospira nitrificans]|uniref:Putative Guanyl-specific ribonuclease Sa n=1 Tax=Candidatus Nitrospira nitrificans TaxID=1742973 RepID=A0A0S4LWG9_9BACT|nr:ribonuclease domain-containing protein [Candidatus Nitrospira nitrificans]CUS39362.1 putative Guanyl-specific ribonuclease Sa [Candidatus Nitrospira nitrificans]